MILLETHPQIAELHKLVNLVPRYPVSAGQLRALAGNRDFNHDVIDFYSLFPADQLFRSREDLLARTEMLEFLLTENQPDEDEVHGAED